MKEQIFTSKECYILRTILNLKIQEFKKAINNTLITDYVKYETLNTIKDIKKILKKIDNPDYQEKTINFNNEIQKHFKKDNKNGIQ